MRGYVSFPGSPTGNPCTRQYTPARFVSECSNSTFPRGVSGQPQGVSAKIPFWGLENLEDITNHVCHPRACSADIRLRMRQKHLHVYATGLSNPGERRAPARKGLCLRTAYPELGLAKPDPRTTGRTVGISEAGTFQSHDRMAVTRGVLPLDDRVMLVSSQLNPPICGALILRGSKAGPS